ncbi:hypothetical protein BH23VER1_BH23VER1_34210 [soil metagenome]
MKQWIQGNEELLWWLGSASVFAFVATLIAVPLLVVRIPQDYFVRDHRSPTFWDGFSPAIRIVLLAVKNVVGAVFVAAGLAMLVLPGQGVLTILAGIMLLNFPGKYRFERWIATRGPVRRSIDWIRHCGGREPLRFGSPSPTPQSPPQTPAGWH